MKGNSPETTWELWSTVYLYVIERNMDENLFKSVKIQLLEQIAFAEMFYFGQIFLYSAGELTKTRWDGFY